MQTRTDKRPAANVSHITFFNLLDGNPTLAQNSRSSSIFLFSLTLSLVPDVDVVVWSLNSLTWAQAVPPARFPALPSGRAEQTCWKWGRWPSAIKVVGWLLSLKPQLCKQCSILVYPSSPTDLLMKVGSVSVYSGLSPKCPLAPHQPGQILLCSMRALSVSLGPLLSDYSSVSPISFPQC